MSTDRTIAGHCPMGCGTTLFVGTGGHITCSHIPCPRPDAVSVILAERETEHIVTLKPHDFSILHPLRERLDQELLRCDLHAYLVGLDGPPRQPGRYCARKAIDGAWTWERLDPPTLAVCRQDCDEIPGYCASGSGCLGTAAPAGTGQNQ